MGGSGDLMRQKCACAPVCARLEHVGSRIDEEKSINAVKSS